MKFFIVLNFKYSGMKTKTDGGVVKFYNILGAIGQSSVGGTNYGLSGVAYYDFGDGQVEGIVTGGSASSQDHCSLYLDPNDPTIFNIYIKHGSEAVAYYDGAKIDCRTLSIK